MLYLTIQPCLQVTYEICSHIFDAYCHGAIQFAKESSSPSLCSSLLVEIGQKLFDVGRFVKMGIVFIFASFHVLIRPSARPLLMMRSGLELIFDVQNGLGSMEITSGDRRIRLEEALRGMFHGAMQNADAKLTEWCRSEGHNIGNKLPVGVPPSHWWWRKCN